MSSHTSNFFDAFSRASWIKPKLSIFVLVLAAGISVCRAQNASVNNAYVDHNMHVDDVLSVSNLSMYDYDTSGEIGLVFPSLPGTPLDGNYDSLSITNNAYVAAGNYSYVTASIAQNLGLGSWWNGTASWSGIIVNFTDLGNETAGNVTSLANSPQAQWFWEQNGASNATEQMSLDWQANLTLIDSNTTNGVSLIPGNFTLLLTNNATVVATISLGNYSITNPATTFSGDGNLSLGGNVIIDAPDEIMNFGSLSISDGSTFSNGTSSTTLGDYTSQYIEFNNGVSIGPNFYAPGLSIYSFSGLAVGVNANATNESSIAIGSNSSSTGIGASTLGNGTSSGNAAIAIGNTSAVSGNDAIAISGGNATSDNGVAMGIGTASQTWGTTVIGRYNQVISGNATAWSSGDPAFIVGIGNSTTQVNGLVVFNNGTCLINGNSTFANPSYISPTSATQPQELYVGQAAIFNGQATLAGNIIVTQPQGDIPVGEYDSSNTH